MLVPSVIRPRSVLLCWLVCALVTACEGFRPPPTASASTPAAGSGANVANGSAGTAHDAAPARDAGAGSAVLLPRNPLQFATGSPHYVFVPNPRERSVAVVDARSLQIRQAACGAHPTLVGASDSADVALALDAEAELGCVVRADAGRVQVDKIALVPDANAIVFAADASFAIAYHDDRFDAPDARLRAQAASVIALNAEEPRALRVAVGLRPHAVTFASDPLRAYVTSDAGVSVIALDALLADPAVSAAPRSFDSREQLPAEAIRVAASGARALAFETDGATLHVLDLTSNAVAQHIELAAWAERSDQYQDLDAGSNNAGAGRIERLRIADAVIEPAGQAAWIALRGEQTLLRVPLTAARDATRIERWSVPGQPSDRLTWLGEPATTLFIAATAANDGRASLLSSQVGHARTRILLAAAPNEVQTALGGEGLALAHRGTQLNGYSVVRASDGAALFRQTYAAPEAIAVSSSIGVVAVAVAETASERATLQVVRFDRLEANVYSLDSAPLSVGFCAGVGQGFAQSTHPDGRLLLVDLESGHSRTLSGFLIASRVQE